MRSLAAAVVVIVTLTSGGARADEPNVRARALAAEATAAGRDGHFLVAAHEFRAAHAIDPRPEYLCNVGVAFHKAQDLPRAQLYLGQCLTRGGALAPAFLDSVRAVFAATEQALREADFAPVDVTVAPSAAAFTISSFDPEDVIVGARLVWLPIGDHVLTVRAEGYVTIDVPIAVRTRDRQPIAVTLEKVPPPQPLPPTVTVPPGEVPVPPRRSPRNAVIATAATGGLALVAGGLYWAARSTAATAGEAGISQRTYADRRDRARLEQHLSWGFAGAAVVGAGLSGWLWYQRAHAAPRIEVTPTGDGATATVSGRF